MLSRHDLMHRPQDVQPLGSRKGVLNKPTELKIDLEELFLSESNAKLLHASLHIIYQQNGGKAGFAKFGKLVRLLQRKFARENTLRDYYTAEWQATGTNNYVDALKAINNDFHKLVYTYFKWNMYNPYHDNIEVGPNEDRTFKKSAEIMPEDFGTLEVWREQFTNVLNRQFRNNNQVPVHRVGLHARHFDRGNEGLRENDVDRASLETPIYAYDMSRIGDTVCNYKSDEWFGV